jgi:hypothetical protein
VWPWYSRYFRCRYAIPYLSLSPEPGQPKSSPETLGFPLHRLAKRRRSRLVPSPLVTGSPTSRHYAPLRAMPRTSLSCVGGLARPPCGRPLRVRSFVPGGLRRLLALVCGAGDQSQLRLRRARLREGRGLSGCGLSVRWWGPVGCPPRLAPEATRLLPGAQPAVMWSGFAGILSSPVAPPTEARSGFAGQARGTTNLSRDVSAALWPPM